VLGWLLRFLLLVLVVRAVWRLIVGVLQGAGSVGSPGVRSGERPVPLVKDAVCGTYVVRAKALTAGNGDDTHYFCSERCRDEFIKTRAGRRSA
jgi:YHS domain-containing protein